MCPWLTKYTQERGRQWTLFCHHCSYHLYSDNFGRIKFSNLSATVGFKRICLRGIFRTQSNIYNGVFFAKIVNGFWQFTFVKKVPSKMFDRVLNMSLCVLG